MTSIKEYTAIKKAELKQKIAESGINPRLAVIQVGNDPASMSYIRGKVRDCEEVGIECLIFGFGENVTETELLNQIRRLNNRRETYMGRDTSRPFIHGIIVQLPLPKHINVKNIQNAIFNFKDVDGFHPLSCFQPCTPLGIINYLKYNNYQFEGKNACVVGRSDIVGKPLARMLTDLDCTVTLCHSKTYDLNRHMYSADLVITCTDKVGYFGISDFDDLTDIIDVGLGRSEDGKLMGNIHSYHLPRLHVENPERILISGTGGVGLLTRLTLLENTYEAMMMQCGGE